MGDSGEGTGYRLREGSDPSCPVVEVWGELDMVSVPGLRTLLAGTSAPAGGRLVLDLTLVRFLGSSAMSALAEVIQRADNGRYQVVVVYPAGNRAVARSLGLVGIDKLVTTVEHLDDLPVR